jgi:hypothetical protein
MKTGIWIITTFIALITTPVAAQYATVLEITDIHDRSLKTKMEKEASALLSELNSAFFNNRALALNKFSGVSGACKSALDTMWSYDGPFRCIESEIIEKCAKRAAGGYQVRNIPLVAKDADENDVYREIAINFDSKGAIDEIVVQVDKEQTTWLHEGKNVLDLERRQRILDFVENFRTAYNRKDLYMLENVYSDNAVIITGKVTTTKETKDNPLKLHGISQPKIDYQVQTKKEYLDNLRRVFTNNTRINVSFEEVEVVQHPKFNSFYYVTLKQGWATSTYSDVGYLLLMIDFKDGESMQIELRTWQPDKVSKEERFQPIDFEPHNI